MEKELRYNIFRELEEENKKLTESDFSISEEELDKVTRYLDREEYLGGIFNADDRPHYFEGTAHLTAKGEEYLEENDKLRKAYNGLKGLRDWIK